MLADNLRRLATGVGLGVGLAFLLIVTVSAHAAPCPVGQKLVIDNGDPGYSETGDDWTTWNNAGQSIGTTYRYLSHTVGGSDRVGTATWKPLSLPADGMYKVEAVFRATENRSTDADYKVHDADGKVSHTSVNQVDGATAGNSHGPVYADLGTHHLKTGSGHVILDGTDDNQSDEADAVVFTLVSCDGTVIQPPSGCDGIKNAGYEVCQGTETTCAGVYKNGVGCNTYCAAAGMVCVAMFGGDSGCQKESTTFPCGTNTGHDSDWCECEGVAPTPDQGGPPKDAGGTAFDSAPLADSAFVQHDQAVQPDAGAQPDAGVSSTPETESVQGGCSIAADPLPSIGVALVCLALALRRRRP